MMGEFSYDMLFQKILGAEETEGLRPPTIRMSSFPFCPKRYLFQCVEYLNGNAKWSFQGDFYCGIGTSVHSTIQKWIPKINPGHVMGHWSCDFCGEWIEDDNPKNYKGRYWKPFVVEAKVGPVRCPRCGKPMAYEEFEFYLPEAPVSGHCDGLLLFDPSSVAGIEINGENYHVLDSMLRDKELGLKFAAYVLEYKTASRNAAQQRAEPKNEHRCQASMYVGAARSVLPKKYGLVNLDVRGFIVKYIARDTPNIRSRDMRIEIDRENAFYNEQCGYVNVFDNAMSNGGQDSKIMFKSFPCRETGTKSSCHYEGCSYGEICGSLTKEEFLAYMKQVRPLYETVRVKGGN